MGKRRVVRLVGVAGSVLMMLAGLPGGLLGAHAALASVARPTVTGPVAGGTPAEDMFSTGFDLAQVGYEEAEYFLSGTATSYASTAPLTPDGKWSVAPAATAPYTTRAVVRRPIDPHKFNGTVVVEWLNVSGGVDAGPDWTLADNELIREGFAWVGVSAQFAGVNAAKGGNPAMIPGDPVRYAELSHPGDSFSYDIFSQAGQAIRDDSALMLRGLRPRKVIAAGESQSAIRLVTYIDAVHPLADVYDGFLVHSRFSSGAPVSQPPQASVPAPATAMIRSDLDVPVFVFETETDVSGSNLADRQPDTDMFRLWEVAGTSHYDDYGLITGPSDTGDGQGAVQNLAAMQDPPKSIPPGFSCNLPINTGGAHWVLDAAFSALNRWVVGRDHPSRRHHRHPLHATVPPVGRLLQTTGVSPVVFAHDANGNVLGGVRSPQVDAPVATLGSVNSGTGGLSAFCGLFGSTVPFSPQQLSALYPSHFQFVLHWDLATLSGLRGGFLTLPDAVELARSAAGSGIGR